MFFFKIAWQTLTLKVFVGCGFNFVFDVHTYFEELIPFDGYLSISNGLKPPTICLIATSTVDGSERNPAFTS